MRQTFVHEGDGLDGWFELVNLAREVLALIDIRDDEIFELVKAAASELSFIETEIRHIDGTDEPEVEDDTLAFKADACAAMAALVAARTLANTFSPNADLSSFETLHDVLLKSCDEPDGYLTLEERNC